MLIHSVLSEGTEYWCGQNLVDSVVTAVQTLIMVLILDTEDTKPLKVRLLREAT